MSDPRWDERLNKNFPAVVQNLQPLLLIDLLLKQGLLENEEYEYVRNPLHMTEEARSRELLSILRKKGPRSFDLFCEVLLAVRSQAFIATDILSSRKKDEPAAIVGGEGQEVGGTSDLRNRSASGPSEKSEPFPNEPNLHVSLLEGSVCKRNFCIALFCIIVLALSYIISQVGNSEVPDDIIGSAKVTDEEYDTNRHRPNSTLSGSFEPSTEIAYIVTRDSCSVKHHDLVFNVDLSEYLLVYDCDNNGDGEEDDVFVARLDRHGRAIQAERSIKMSLPGPEPSVQGSPSVAYNPKYQQYLVSFCLKSSALHGNKFVIATCVIPLGTVTTNTIPRISVKYADSKGIASNARKPVVAYNPVTHGYVLAAELEHAWSGRFEIVSAYLNHEGSMQSGVPVFSYKSDVLQPNFVFVPGNKSFVFVSQIDKSYSSSSLDHYGFLLKSQPAEQNFERDSGAIVIGDTFVSNSAITLHGIHGTNCLGVCYTADPNHDGSTVPSCSRVCNNGQKWIVEGHDAIFCPCLTRVTNPFVIDHPTKGIFAVWEEEDETGRRLHGYYVNSQNFVQTPPTKDQRHPLAMYNPKDDEVCVAWQYQFDKDALNKLAFRCFRFTESCNDPCCCQK